jgi:hypothetical protein
MAEKETEGLKQSAQATVDAIRLACASKFVAPDERILWVIEQILAFAPPTDPSSTEGARAFHEAVKDWNGTNRENVTLA